jgi:tetratricopeptide (TPR) repeat protein
VSIAERALGPEHLSIATALINLAELYRTRSRYAEAEPLLKRSLEIREKILGLEHFELIDPLHKLGTIYMAHDRYDEAKAVSMPP